MSKSVRSTPVRSTPVRSALPRWPGGRVMSDSLAPNELRGNGGTDHMRVMVIRHHAQDSAEFITEAFQARGAEVVTYLYPDGGPLPPFDDVDHIVMLGAIPSIYDPAIGWIEPELDWLRAVDEAGVPVLGVCYGAQELCTLFGGKVVAADRKEVGWLTIDTVRPD